MLGTVCDDGGLEYEVPLFDGEWALMRAYHWRPLRVYLAGPMTGYKDLNHPEFHAATERLREAGFVVENPAELSKPEERKPWSWWMRRCLSMMFTCDAIVTLPNSIFSVGARSEAFLGGLFDMPVYSEEGLCSLLTPFVPQGVD
jgi:hypothetical protein